MKLLFWVGLGFQIIQLSIAGLICLSLIDWSFITSGMLIGIGLVYMNLISVLFMIMGARD